MRLLLLLFLFAAGPHNPPTIKSKPVPVHLVTDTASSVSVRPFDGAAILKFSHQPEFNYHEETMNPSLWVRFWHWFWAFIRQLFGGSAKTSGGFAYYFFLVLRYVFLVGGLGALIVLLLKLAGINVNVFRKSPSSSIPYSEFFEDIHQIDFEAEIENAIAQHNYRFAVRLLYLKSLKKLSDAGTIEWQIDKTNSTYINELANERQRSAFKKLTQQFEYIWYGEFFINRQVYERIHSSFNEFNNGVV